VVNPIKAVVLFEEGYELFMETNHTPTLTAWWDIYGPTDF